MEANTLFRKKALEKLRSPEQLNVLLTVTSSQSWILLLALVSILAAAILWGLFGTLRATVPASGVLVGSAGPAAPGEAVLYVSIGAARRIQPGMLVHLAPATVRKEEYGMLVGVVTSVAPAPSTQADMLHHLENDALVQSFASAGSLIAVHVQLQPDPARPGSPLWTFAAAPPIALRAGTFTQAGIVVSEQRPLELVFPVLRTLGAR